MVPQRCNAFCFILSSPRGTDTFRRPHAGFNVFGNLTCTSTACVLGKLLSLGCCVRIVVDGRAGFCYRFKTT